MNILHYTIGVPPLRKGGAVDYVMRLAKEQEKMGENVSILYPGSLKLYGGDQTTVKRINSVGNIKIYVLKNPLPISINSGFYSYRAFMKKKEVSKVIQFLKDNKIEIIHLHTVSGFPLELIMEIKKMLNIKLFYTTHDYLGISPNRLFYLDGMDYSNNNTTAFWYLASEKGLVSKIKTFIFQSEKYSKIRPILKKVRKIAKKRSGMSDSKTAFLKNIDVSQKSQKEIEELREYYRKLFSYMDFFLFNSSVSRRVFENNLKDITGEIVKITNLKNNIIQYRSVNSDKIPIRIGYIGPYFEEYKGFYMLYNASIHYEKNRKFIFVFMGDDQTLTGNNILNVGQFDTKNKERVYQNIDVLVIASDSKETFGLIGLEALENGVPVISSSNAGFKDMLPDQYVFNNVDSLYQLLDKSTNYNKFYHSYFGSLGYNSIMSIKEHAKIIVDKYRMKLY